MYLHSSELILLFRTVRFKEIKEEKVYQRNAHLEDREGDKRWTVRTLAAKKGTYITTHSVY